MLILPTSRALPRDFSIDQSKHSLFGASKLAGDILVQEYGRYFGMPTCCLRGGCLTGPWHAAVELHGFLSYLVKVNVTGGTYSAYGYKGKQVRDNIHSHDVARFAEEFINAPRPPRSTTAAVAGRTLARSSRRSSAWRHDRQTHELEVRGRARDGDHICYISDLRKMKQHYPNWTLTKSLDDIFDELVAAWTDRALAVSA